MMDKLKVNKVYSGNSLDVLKTLPDESIDMCITSPPYWGLRDYGTEGQIWGGDDECEHDFKSSTRKLHSGSWGEKDNALPHQKNATILNWEVEDRTCSKCGAWKGELGLEPTPEMFISNLCDIFDEIKRVLRPHGSCYVNLGDSYCRNPGQQDQSGKTGIKTFKYNYNFKHKKNYGSAYKTKSLVQIPSRFGIEMTNRGWVLRNEIIWHKPSCLPASVQDRYTVDFEKMFFFTKNPKYYFKQQIEETKDSLQRNKRTVWHINTASFKDAHFAVYPPNLLESPIDASCPEFVDKKTGKPRERVIEKNQDKVTTYHDKGYQDGRDDSEFEPGIVLDPFFGSGTTAQVAMSQDKDWVGIELNPDYEEISVKRLKPKIVEKKTRDKANKFWDVK